MEHQSINISELRTEQEAADQYRMPRLTLKHWRHVSKGPRYVRLGRRVFYRQSDLDAYLSDQTQGGEAA